MVVVGPQHRRPDPDVLDRALVRACPDLVADHERAGQQDEDPGQQVLEHVPEGEANGDAADAEEVEQVGGGDGGEGNRGRHQERHQDGHAARDAPEHRRGTRRGLPQRGGAANGGTDPSGDEQAEAEQHEGDGQPR